MFRSNAEAVLVRPECVYFGGRDFLSTLPCSVKHFTLRVIQSSGQERERDRKYKLSRKCEYDHCLGQEASNQTNPILIL